MRRIIFTILVSICAIAITLRLYRPVVEPPKGPVVERPVEPIVKPKDPVVQHPTNPVVELTDPIVGQRPDPVLGQPQKLLIEKITMTGRNHLAAISHDGSTVAYVAHNESGEG